jgi:hypothetical protein
MSCTANAVDFEVKHSFPVHLPDSPVTIHIQGRKRSSVQIITTPVFYLASQKLFERAHDISNANIAMIPRHCILSPEPDFPLEGELLRRLVLWRFGVEG